MNIFERHHASIPKNIYIASSVVEYVNSRIYAPSFYLTMMEPPEVPTETDFTAVFQAFRQSNSTVADLVIALLTEKCFKRSTKLAELLKQSGKILKVLLSHTRLPASAKKAASNAMQPLYAKEIRYLVKSMTGWHFSAHTAMPEDIDNFDLAMMASDTVEHAPLLSMLFDALLSAKKKGSWTSQMHHTEGDDVTMGVDDFENNAVDSNSDEG